MSAADLALAIFQTLANLLELIANLCILLINPAVNASDVWNVTYSASSFGYWLIRPFVGEGGGLDLIKENTTALREFANMTKYLGANAEQIFGNQTGSHGVSAVLKNATGMIDQDFALKFWRAVEKAVSFAIKQMGNVTAALR